MKVVWDEPKRILNMQKHGLDFAQLTPEFFVESVLAPACSGRWKAIGKLGDGTVAAIFVKLGIEGISIISLRPASKSERIQYDQEATATHH